MLGPQIDPLTILMPASPLQGPLEVPAPVVADTATDARRASLDSRMTAVLRGAAQGFGCTAAELWLLDNATKCLRRRVAWGQGADQKADARHLAETEADLAALSGGAVVLETPDEVQPWGLHRAASSAVCLPVSSDRTIHGVLWLFGEEARPFADTEVEVIEIIATRLAVEIERDALLASR